MFRKLYGKRKEDHSVSDEHIDGIKVGVLASALAYKYGKDGKDSLEAYGAKLTELDKELTKYGNERVGDPKPFFKEYRDNSFEARVEKAVEILKESFKDEPLKLLNNLQEMKINIDNDNAKNIQKAIIRKYKKFDNIDNNLDGVENFLSAISNKLGDDYTMYKNYLKEKDKNGAVKRKEHAGYVIETEKEILVAHHGTQADKILHRDMKLTPSAIDKLFRGKQMPIFGEGATEVINDLNFFYTPMTFGKHTTNVHSGFANEYRASRNSLDTIINKLDENKPIAFTGHSLGGAVAQMAALDAATNHAVISEELKKDKNGQDETIAEIKVRRKVSGVYTYGGPRVFSDATIYEKSHLTDRTFRTVHSNDKVVTVPPLRLGFQHVGQEIRIENDRSLNSLKSHALDTTYKEFVTQKQSFVTQDKQKPASFYSTMEFYTSYVMKATHNMFKAYYVQEIASRMGGGRY